MSLNNSFEAFNLDDNKNLFKYINDLEQSLN